jgi:hypothetical protein
VIVPGHRKRFFSGSGRANGQAPGLDLRGAAGRQLDRPSTDRWRSGWSAVIGKQLMQVGEAQPGRDGLEADTVELAAILDALV